MTRPHPTRRAALAGAAVAPLAAALPRAAAATETPPPAPAIAPWRRMRLGDFTVTTLLAGSRPLEAPHGTFGLNVSDETFAAASAAAFLPADRSLNFFTPVLVETGGETVLFDTGLAPDGVLAALAAAGHAPEDVTLVVITHMHGDHIGGLSAGGVPTFPKARCVTGRIEWDHWAAAGNETFEARVRPLADRFTFLADGDTVTPGITASLAPGHTPGHMIFRLESAGRALMLTADTANHYLWSVGHPDWEVRFDMDRAQAIATRQRVLGAIAAERIPFIGYHMPFPGAGFLEPTETGFRFVPMSYQLDL